MSDGDRKPNMQQLQRDLVARQEEYEVADAAAREADRAKSHARDRLSEAQRALDTAFAMLRADAPWDTAWHRASRTSPVPSGEG